MLFYKINKFFVKLLYKDDKIEQLVTEAQLYTIVCNKFGEYSAVLGVIGKSGINLDSKVKIPKGIYSIYKYAWFTKDSLRKEITFLNKYNTFREIISLKRNIRELKVIKGNSYKGVMQYENL